MFTKYGKIKRLGDDENIGILQGRVTIQEKIDGANASFYYDTVEDVFVYCSRSGPKGKVRRAADGKWYPDADGFRGLGKWLADTLSENDTLVAFLVYNPSIQIFGEWLVKHQVEYNKYGVFYMYDVYDHDNEKMCVLPDHISEWAAPFGIPSVPVFATLVNPTVEDLDVFVGQTELAITEGEGIVIKNPNFVNFFGRHAYAKRVCEKFTEFKPKVKVSRDNIEQAIVDKFVTEGRINKIVINMNHEKHENPSMKWMKEVLGRHWHDMINEEIHAIVKFVRNDKFQFSQIKKIHDMKVREIFSIIMDKNAS